MKLGLTLTVMLGACGGPTIELDLGDTTDKLAELVEKAEADARAERARRAANPEPRPKVRRPSDVPAAATRTIARVREAIASRDFVALRGTLAQNVIDIDTGRERSRTVALRQWKSTPKVLEQVAIALAGECEVEAVDGAADDAEVEEVTCGSPERGPLFVILWNEAGPDTFEIAGVGSF